MKLTLQPGQTFRDLDAWVRTYGRPDAILLLAGDDLTNAAARRWAAINGVATEEMPPALEPVAAPEPPAPQPKRRGRPPKARPA